MLPWSSCYYPIPILEILNHCGTYIVYFSGDGRFGVRSCFHMIWVAGILGIVDVYLHLLTQLEWANFNLSEKPHKPRCLPSEKGWNKCSSINCFLRLALPSLLEVVQSLIWFDNIPSKCQNGLPQIPPNERKKGYRRGVWVGGIQGNMANECNLRFINNIEKSLWICQRLIYDGGKRIAAPPLDDAAHKRHPWLESQHKL